MVLRPGRPAVVLYDADRMVEDVARENDVCAHDAEEHLAFNVWGAYIGRETPLYASFHGIEESE